jgi:ketosteroid isomerase-like protein
VGPRCRRSGALCDLSACFLARTRVANRVLGFDDRRSRVIDRKTPLAEILSTHRRYIPFFGRQPRARFRNVSEIRENTEGILQLLESEHLRRWLSRSRPRDTERAMSEENVEVVREALAAWNDRDLERWLACWDSRGTWVPELHGAAQRIDAYRGHDGLRSYWGDEDAASRRYPVKVQTVRHEGAEVVAIAVARPQARNSRSGTTRRMAFRFRVRRGKIIRGERYLHVSDALVAAGLEE